MKKKLITTLLIGALMLQTSLGFAADSATSTATAQNTTEQTASQQTSTAADQQTTAAQSDENQADAQAGETSAQTADNGTEQSTAAQEGEAAEGSTADGNTESSDTSLEEEIASQQTKVIVSSYGDVSVDNVNLEAIEEMKTKNIMVGYEDGTFKPEKLVTRAEFVKMLVEHSGGTDSIADGVLTGFSDVDDVDHWAKKYIYVGVNKGYLLGMGDGLFMPDETITYEQALKILVCYVGKEVAAKAKVSVNTPLWPTAYVLTGEQLELNKKTTLSLGETVNRASIAQLTSNALNVYSASNNVYMGTTSSGRVSSGGGGGGGGGRTKDEENNTKRIYGMIVSTPGVCIDTEADAVTDPYILVKSNDVEGGYIKLRVPKSGGEDPYSSLLGYMADITYAKNDAMLNEIISLKSDSTNKSITVKAEDFRRSASTEKMIAYFDSNGNKKEIKLPDNLQDLKVVYNGVPIDKKHPPYNYTDTTFETPMITLDDIMPQTGSVRFVNCDSGAYDLAVVTTYDTLIALSTVSSSTGIVIDKYNLNKSYQLDRDKLFAELNSLDINASRGLKADDISVTITAKNSTTELKPSSISRNNVLTVYASKDRCKINIVKCSDYAGGSSSTGQRVTQEYDSADSTVYLRNTKYVISNYFINRFDSAEDIAELFPYDGTVVALLDSFGEIVDVEEKEPSYEYGYLAYAEYEARNPDTGKPSLTMRIITASNYSRPQSQYQEYSVATKFKLNGVTYKSETYDEADIALKESAARLNSARESATFNSFPYAQPVKIELSDGNSMQIKSMITLDKLKDEETNTTLFYPLEEYNFYSSVFTAKSNSSTKQKVESSTVVISVPDNVYDYSSYKVTKGTSGLTSYSTHNVEAYLEKNTSAISQSFPVSVLLLCDESLTSYPTAATYPFIVKSISPRQYINDEYVTTIEGYEPTTATSTTLKTYTVDPKYIGGGSIKTVDTNVEIEIGDVIVFGKSPDGKYIRNIYQLVDASDKDSMGLDERYDAYSRSSTSDNPYYWRRYGLVTVLDTDNTELLLDVDGNEMVINSSALIDSSKPIVFAENEESGKMEVSAPGTLLSELNPEDDLMFLYSYAPNTSSNQTFRTVYIIKRDDRDSHYPDPERSYETVTFNVNPVGSDITLVNRRDNTISYYASDDDNDGVITVENVQSGNYSYYASCGDGYDVLSGTMKIAYGETPAAVSVKLAQSSGSLIFNLTKPSDLKNAKAKVTIKDENDKEYTYEKTTANIQTDVIPIGLYEYTIVMEGCKTATGYALVEKDKDELVRVTIEKE